MGRPWVRVGFWGRYTVPEIPQAEAAEKMAEAIEDQGLEVSEYREIGYLLENDADLPERLDRVAVEGS